MKLTVTTAAQQIFPAGQQGSLMVNNEGPSTVYLDNSSAVSTDQSTPLPATASVVWPAGEPLWAVAKEDKAVVRMTNGASIVEASRAAVDTTLFRDPAAAFSSHSYETALIEVSAYNSLQLLFNDHIASMPSASEFYTFTFLFYDALQQPIDGERFILSYSGLDNSSSLVLRLPVKGAYVQLLIGDKMAASIVADILLTATSRIYDKGWSYAFVDNDTFTLRPAIGNPPIGTTIVTFSDDSYLANDYSAGGFYAIYPSGLYSGMHIANRNTSGGITVAGAYRLRALIDSGVYFDELTLPVGATNLINDKDIRMPQTMATLLTATAPTGGTHHLSLLFKNSF